MATRKEHRRPAESRPAGPRSDNQEHGEFSALTSHSLARLPWWLRLLLPAIVVIGAFLPFLPALQADFVNWDDDKVLVNNPRFRGFTADNLHWMFTQYKMGHYHPLTWLSYAVDFAVAKAWFGSGMKPAVYHFTNLLLHAGVALSFYFLARLLLQLVLPPPPDRPDVAASAAAAVAALLFACHPLRVETVAWVTERRDVLSTLFLLPCLICYVRYATDVGRPARWGFYMAAVLLLGLSLLSKAWGITLPVVMLLLDVYPLRRLGGRAGWISAQAVNVYCLEKLPFYALAAFFAYKAHSAQALVLDTMKSLSEWGVDDRISQAFYGLAFYSWKTLWPFGLLPLVEIPVDNDPWSLRYVLSAAAVLAAGGLLLLLARRWPSGLLLGLCYVVILSPVLGFAQSGPQLVADRYSYVGCLTWALLAGGALLWLWRRPPILRWALPAGVLAAVGSIAVVVGLSCLTWRQTQVWRDSRSLWEYVVKLDPRCVMARSNLGMLERKAGNRDRAIEHYQAARAVKPDDVILLNNLAVALAEDKSRLGEAIEVLEQAVRVQPKHPDVHRTLGNALQEAGRQDEALEHFQKCVNLKPDGNPAGHRALAEACFHQGDLAKAEKHYRLALQQDRALDPRSSKVVWTLNGLARVLEKQGRPADAAGLYEQALAIDAKDPAAREGLQRTKRGSPSR